MGVNVDEDFAPVYIVPADKKKQVNKLKDLLKGVDQLYLATDETAKERPFRGTCSRCSNQSAVHRLVFHEITKEAIHNALAHPREIDEGLVRAQENSPHTRSPLRLRRVATDSGKKLVAVCRPVACRAWLCD